MEKINSIGTDLFNKIRGRFDQVNIGDADGNVTSDPAEARFFEFEYTSNGMQIGKVSVNVTDDDLTVIYNKDILDDKPDIFKKQWYNFLKEMRKFAKRRLLQFDVRDINKTNLDRRDYKFLAKTRNGDEEKMNESKLYGTAHTSYQRVDGARIVIKHNAPINTENAAARTQHVSAIYIESAEGERFKYPYKHLSGARAMARHVSEGGKLYDDFGSHIVSLSEEIYKLRKFKSYMNKSNVMAESLAEYMDVVNTRLAEVKKTIDRLQKTNHYREAVEGFEKPILEEVPNDVAESWIDQLTIKQFNEELKDVFPYIYRLVGEAKRVETVALEDAIEEANPCWKGYKQIGMKEKQGKKVPNCVPEEIELEKAFESMLGQFAEDEIIKKKVSEAYDEATSEWPFVKFREKKFPNGETRLMALVNTSAPSPDAFTSKSPDTKIYTVVNRENLDKILGYLKRSNNSTGVNVVLDGFLDRISNAKMYPQYQFVFDWLKQLTRAELKTTPYFPETVSAGPKPKIIFVDVRFSNGEIETLEGSTLEPLELLVNVNDENYDGNPFVQGTPVLVKNTESKRRGQQGTVVRSRMPEPKKAEKAYANQKFKDIIPKIEQPYERVLVLNTKAFNKLRKEYTQMFSKYYKPTRAYFEILPSDLEKFKALVYSDKFESAVGNPQLHFLDSVEAVDQIPPDLLNKLPPNIQKIAQGGYNEIEYTDDDEREKEEPSVDTGPIRSTTSFKNFINKLARLGLAKNFTMSREDFKQIEPIDRSTIQLYMKELEQEQDVQTARNIAAEIIMLQKIFPSEHAERFEDVETVIKQISTKAIKKYMQEWFATGLGSIKGTGQSLTAVAGMPDKMPIQMPAGTTPPPELGNPAADEKFKEEDIELLKQIKNLEAAKTHVFKMFDNSSMTLETNRKYKNRVQQMTSVDQIQKLIFELILNWEKLNPVNKTLPSGLYKARQDIQRQFKNPNVRGSFKKENIEETAKIIKATKWSDGKVSIKIEINGKTQVIVGSLDYVKKRLQQDFGLSMPMNFSIPEKNYPPTDTSNKKSKRVPFTEFILSHYDRNTGQFPRGETAVLTMIEKDYGERYIEPAKQFIERLTLLIDQYQVQSQY